MRYDFVGLFHLFIIANLFLFFSGCGYKSDPVYKNIDKDSQYLSRVNRPIEKVKRVANL